MMNMMMKTNFNILESVKIKDIPKNWIDPCKHIRIELDVERRILHCQDCKVDLEPFDYLLYHGRRFFGVWQRIGEQRKAELENLCREVEGLKREKEGLKASIKRIKNENKL